MNIRTLLTILVGSLAAFFLPREQAHGTFAPLDRGHVAWLMANRPQPSHPTTSTVIFARLDDLDHPESERQFEAWPPTLLEWSGLLEEMAALHPRTVVLPSAAAWATQPPEPLLEKSCRALPGLQLGTRAEAPGTVQETALSAFPRVQGDVSGIPSFTSVTAEPQLSALGKLSFSQVDLSENPLAKPSLQESVFRLPLLFRQDQRVFPALILQSLLHQAQIPLDQVEITLGQTIKIPGHPAIPIDPAGGYLFHDLPINAQALLSLNVDTFKMDPATRERFLSQDDPVRKLLPQLTDALIWVGEDHREARRFQPPEGRTVSLAELSLRALQAMQTGRNVTPQSFLGQALTLVGILLYGLWLARLRRAQLWKMTLLGVLLLGLASLLTFQTNGLWMPVGPGVVLLGLIWLVNFVVPAPKVA